MNMPKTVYEGQWIHRKLPENACGGDVRLFEKMLNGWSREVQINTFHKVSVNAELFMKQHWKVRIMVSSFGDIWQDSVFNQPLYQLKSFVKDRLRRPKKIERAIWCFDLFSTGGYYHWITEICPRLWVASVHIPQDIPLLVPSYFLSKWKFAVDFFKPFNREIILFDEGKVAKVNELIFVGQTGGIFNFQPEPIHRSTEVLKRTYTQPGNLKQKYKIYISRRKSGKRMILNETHVINIVKKYDYQVVCTEDLSIPEQIELFANTTHLISIHGAGLSNMVFMPEGSTIIEIRHRDDNHMLTCFFTLAHTFKHAYFYTFGDDLGDSLLTEVRPEDKSIHADLTMLDNLLLSIQ